MTEPRLTDTDIDWVEADLNALAIFHGNIVALRGAQALRQVRAERGGDTGYDCVYCGARIFRMVVGAGDGTGQRFAHFECSTIRDLHQAEAERDTAREQVRRLREALKSVEWSGPGAPRESPDRPVWPTCPSCHGMVNKGHLSNCRSQEALAASEQEG